MHILLTRSPEEPYEKENQRWRQTDEIVKENPTETDLLPGIDSPKALSSITLFIQNRHFLGEERQCFAAVSLGRSTTTKPTKIWPVQCFGSIETLEEFMPRDWRNIVHWLWVVPIIDVLNGRKLILLGWSVLPNVELLALPLCLDMVAIVWLILPGKSRSGKSARR